MPNPNAESVLARLYQSAVTEEQKRKVNTLLGLLEVGGNFGTSSLAQLGGGLAYLPAAAMGGDAAGQAVMRRVQDAYTYQPRSEAGQGYLGALGNLVGPIAKSGSVGAQTFADNVYGATGSPVLGAAARAAPTAIDALGDRLRLGGFGQPNRNEITAYHGGPHDFDEFDMSKMGTGEGAQMYGHGLYFAENPMVAKEYQKAISNDAFATKNGLFYPERELAHVNVKAAFRRGGLDEAIDTAKKYATPDADYPQVAEIAAQDLAKLQKIKESGGVSKNEGRLYTVDIPDEHVANMLDWDKPLSQQPKQVRKAFSDFVNSDEGDALAREYWSYKEGNKLTDLPEWKDPYGETIHKVAFGGGQRATNWYMKNGIPGIRYLDEGSRGKEKGTSNFVVFDDKLVKVLKKE